MRVLFLCTGNACRSQMAEGLARHLSNGDIDAASAGIEAHGLNPLAVETMKEIGIDVAGQTSKVVEKGMIDSSELVITVCDHAREFCPVVPSHVRQLHWSFDDPARAVGTPEDIRTVFRRVRDELAEKIEELIEVELYGRV